MNSCTLMITTAGSPRRSTMKRSFFVAAKAIDLSELGPGDMGIDAAAHPAVFRVDELTDYCN
jgi:hypothetical protein